MYILEVDVLRFDVSGNGQTGSYFGSPVIIVLSQCTQKLEITEALTKIRLPELFLIALRCIPLTSQGNLRILLLFFDWGFSPGAIHSSFMVSNWNVMSSVCCQVKSTAMEG